jgi:hypothetical protein
VKCLLPIERYTKHEAFARTVDAGKSCLLLQPPSRAPPPHITTQLYEEYSRRLSDGVKVLQYGKDVSMTDHIWQFDPRPPVMASVRRRAIRWTLASIVAMIAALALSVTTTFADLPSCIDQANGRHYPSSPVLPEFWYAQIMTGTITNPYFETLGAKGNLTTGGNPQVFDSTSQHVTRTCLQENKAMAPTPRGYRLAGPPACSADALV